MIEFHYETDFKIENENKFVDWLSRVIVSENFLSRQLDYIFCGDDYLLNLNQKYLSHDTYTDIITFDYPCPKSDLSCLQWKGNSEGQYFLYCH